MHRCDLGGIGLRNLPFLSKLGIKTAVVLTPEKPTKEVADWMRVSGIDLVRHAHPPSLVGAPNNAECAP